MSDSDKTEKSSPDVDSSDTATGVATPTRRGTTPDLAPPGRPASPVQRDWESDRRLAAVFAEEDAEISARIGEDITVAYRFVCQHCRARFSLQQQLEAHEASCGGMRADKEASMAANGQRPITCKHCGHVSPSLTAHAAHLLEAHRAETLARRRELAERRKAECGGLSTPAPATTPRPAAIPARASAATSMPAAITHRRCPLCDGALPPATAQLVAALQAEGLAEDQAFTAARVARQVLCIPPA